MKLGGCVWGEGGTDEGQGLPCGDIWGYRQGPGPCGAAGGEGKAVGHPQQVPCPQSFPKERGGTVPGDWHTLVTDVSG